VPEAFNLLDFFDVPGAFLCGPPTTDGFSIWETGPFLDPAPYQVKLQGRGAVPVWFLSTEEYVAAVSDGELTIGDLEALNPLKGTASQFNEVLHPLEVANVTKLIVRMKGHLDDGRQFQANSVSVGDGVNQNKFTVFPAIGPEGITGIAPVPEPGALLLVSLGALSLLAFRRRR
jgi:hypothetical protein